jgi:ubiquinone/menaquinone biosynthesis C-methylase UbiE
MFRRTTQAWQAADEFAYYCPRAELSEEHARRQRHWAEERYFFGQRLLRNLGVGSRALLDGRDILDIGAGEACVSQAMSSIFRPRSVWAVDAVPKQIWAAAALGQQERMRYLLANALDLPFPDGSFDLVVAHLFVHHVPERRQLLVEVRRVLRPGGEFRCYEPSAIVDFLGHFLRGDHNLSRNERPLGPRELAGLMREVFGNETHQGYWSRFQSECLGPFSPSVRFVSKVHGHPPISPPEPQPSRPLEPTPVPNLWLDSRVSFRDRIERQFEQLKRDLEVLITSATPRGNSGP